MVAIHSGQPFAAKLQRTSQLGCRHLTLLRCLVKAHQPPVQLDERARLDVPAGLRSGSCDGRIGIMAPRRRKLAGAVLHWVTARDEDTTELLNSWSFRTLKEAERKRIEQEEAAEPPGHQTNVAIETLPTLLNRMPPKFLTSDRKIAEK